jgi:predicted RNase H-like HicB family nuclease
MSAVAEIMFQVEPCAETGGYVARWDPARGGGGITTQGDSFAELDAMIADAVGGYFEPKQRPRRIRLHFSQDPILAVA